MAASVVQGLETKRHVVYQLLAEVLRSKTVKAIERGVEWLLEKLPAPIPEKEWEQANFSFEAAGHDVKVRAGADEFLWCFTYSHPSKNDPRDRWSVDFSVKETQVGVRVCFCSAAARPTDYSRPRLIDMLVQSPGLGDGWYLSSSPCSIKTKEDLDRLFSLAESPNRFLPILVFDSKSLVKKKAISHGATWDLHQFASKCVGLAHVVDLCGSARLGWTTKVGPAWSLSENTIRIYNPGVNFSSTGSEVHPSFSPDAVRTWNRSKAGELQSYLYRFSASRTVDWNGLKFFDDLDGAPSTRGGPIDVPSIGKCAANEPSPEPMVTNSKLLLPKLHQHTEDSGPHLHCWGGNSVDFCRRRLASVAKIWAPTVAKDVWRLFHASLLTCRLIHIPEVSWAKAYTEAMGAESSTLSIIPVEPDWLNFLDCLDAGVADSWSQAVSDSSRLHLIVLQGLDASVVQSWLRPILNLHCGLTTALSLKAQFNWPDNLRVIWQSAPGSEIEGMLMRTSARLPNLAAPASERTTNSVDGFVEFRTWLSWATAGVVGSQLPLSNSVLSWLGDAAKTTIVEVNHLRRVLQEIGLSASAADRQAAAIRLGFSLNRESFMANFV